MSPAEVEATFPGGQRLPRPIADVYSFLKGHGYPISGCFELRASGMGALKAWFGDDSPAVAQLLPFDSGASGDIYALWLTEGLPPD